ncbi:MAG: T9SS type A sorting domain-containing protein [Flavobacteriales bacterium]
MGLSTQITIRGAHPINSAVCGASLKQGLQITLLQGNPAQGRFTLQVDTDQAARLALRVLDAQGRVMVDEDRGMSNGLQQRTYSIDSWALGTYFVTVFNNGRPMAKRLVVQ